MFTAWGLGFGDFIGVLLRRLEDSWRALSFGLKRAWASGFEGLGIGLLEVSLNPKPTTLHPKPQNPTP